MDIFSVPIEVVDANVLPYLEWNDLLRLRRVCKWTKAIVDGYLKVNLELAPEIEIDEKGNSFGAFLDMGIPTTRIFLNNTSGDQFYEGAGEDGATFLEQYGPLVKSLRVDQLSIFIIGREWKFLNGLKNIEGFEADRYGDCSRALSSAEAEEVLEMKLSLAKKDPNFFQNGKVRFPKEFAKRLKSMKVRNITDSSTVIDQLFGYNGGFFSEGKALRSIALPFSTQATTSCHEMYTICDSSLGVVFVDVLTYINERGKENPSLENFKEIDLVSHHHRKEQLREQLHFEWNASEYFIGLCKMCVMHGVKLQNVASTWFVQRNSMTDPGEREHFADVGMPVRSLVNMHPSVLSLELPNLERIQIMSTSRSSPGPDWQNERPDWPSLKALDITVDSRRCEYFDWSRQFQRPIMTSTVTTELFNFFFEDVSRTAMTELRLEFKGRARAVAIPNTEHIVASCPNLKKLTLVNWPGTNKALTKFWSGLPGLEEVSLENCEGLGNVAFVGEDARSPVFLKLKKLRKLSLKGLDKMPKITDTLFSLVIRHLALTHLTLTSNAPVKSITGAGVGLLCDGKFAESIQRFSFKNWLLSNVTEEEFQNLEELFRSSKML